MLEENARLVRWNKGLMCWYVCEWRRGEEERRGQGDHVNCIVYIVQCPVCEVILLTRLSAKETCCHRHSIVACHSVEEWTKKRRQESMSKIIQAIIGDDHSSFFLHITTTRRQEERQKTSPRNTSERSMWKKQIATSVKKKGEREREREGKKRKKMKRKSCPT